MWTDGVMVTVTVVAAGQERDDYLPSNPQFLVGVHHSVDNVHLGGIRVGLFVGSNSRGTCVQLRHNGSTKDDCRVHARWWTSAGQDENRPEKAGDGLDLESVWGSQQVDEQNVPSTA